MAPPAPSTPSTRLPRHLGKAVKDAPPVDMVLMKENARLYLLRMTNFYHYLAKRGARFKGISMDPVLEEVLEMVSVEELVDATMQGVEPYGIVTFGSADEVSPETGLPVHLLKDLDMVDFGVAEPGESQGTYGVVYIVVESEKTKGYAVKGLKEILELLNNEDDQPVKIFSFSYIGISDAISTPLTADSLRARLEEIYSNPVNVYSLPASTRGIGRRLKDHCNPVYRQRQRKSKKPVVHYFQSSDRSIWGTFALFLAHKAGSLSGVSEATARKVMTIVTEASGIYASGSLANGPRAEESEVYREEYNKQQSNVSLHIPARLPQKGVNVQVGLEGKGHYWWELLTGKTAYVFQENRPLGLTGTNKVLHRLQCGTSWNLPQAFNNEYRSLLTGGTANFRLVLDPNEIAPSNLYPPLVPRHVDATGTPSRYPSVVPNASDEDFFAIVCQPQGLVGPPDDRRQCRPVCFEMVGPLHEARGKVWRAILSQAAEDATMKTAADDKQEDEEDEEDEEGD